MYFLVEQYRYPVKVLKQIFGECLGEFTKDSLRTFAGDKIDYKLSENKRFVKFDYVGYCYFSFKEKELLSFNKNTYHIDYHNIEFPEVAVAEPVTPVRHRRR